MFFQSYIQELEDSKKGIFKDVLLFRLFEFHADP